MYTLEVVQVPNQMQKYAMLDYYGGSFFLLY